MTKFFHVFKKNAVFAYFWPIFPIFGAKKTFQENPALPHTISYGFLASCQNLEKTNDTVPTNCLDRRKDRQTLF